MKNYCNNLYYSIAGISLTAVNAITLLLQPIKTISENMYNIHFKFEKKGLEPITISNAIIGDSILETALKNDIDLHHNCGGVCACSTCHIYVMGGDEHLEALSDKEEDFIDRAVNPRITSRLGCQCVLVDGSGDIEVLLPDQSQFLGE